MFFIFHRSQYNYNYNYNIAAIFPFVAKNAKSSLSIVSATLTPLILDVSLHPDMKRKKLIIYG